jgi:RND family efflux transporter MFP subunit
MSDKLKDPSNPGPRASNVQPIQAARSAQALHGETHTAHSERYDKDGIVTSGSPQNLDKDDIVSGRGSKVPLAVTTFLIGGAVMFAGIFAVGLIPRMQHKEKVAATAREDAKQLPLYAVTTIKPGNKTASMSLPANIQAIQEFNIFARCDGYLKQRLVDIGDRVKKGQLLMVIDAPELEQQLKGAQAALQQAKAQHKSAEADLAQSVSLIENNKATVKRLIANMTFARRELHRYEELANQGAVSVEQRDEKLRDLDADKASVEAANAAVAAAQAQAAANREKIAAAKASVEAADAGVREVQSMASFQRVLAPCDGVITARNVDAGALVSKGSSTNNQALMKMARTDVLRVFVYIPQSDYQGVYAGMHAQISVAELRDRVFDGTIAHISGGMDPTSRTLQTEIQIPNQAGTLLPGMYAQVKLSTDRDNPPVLIPDPAVVVKPEGQFVITVSKEGNVHYQQVKLGRDFGHESEVLSGLTPGTVIATEPSNDLKEGQKISTRFAKTSEK